MRPLTDTPSSLLPVVASEDVLAQLELPAALAVVAAHAAGALGAASVRSRRPGAEVAGVAEELRRVDQLAWLLRRGEGFSPDPVADLAPTLRALTVDGAVLEGAALAEVGRVLVSIQHVADGLRRALPDAPALAALLVEPPPPDLAKMLTAALDPDGAVRDGASPQVERARRAIRERRARLVQFLEGLLRSLAPQHAPADGTVTLRGGRYVVPIHRDARGRVGGIVHAESGSGATLFVEPAAAVELGNDLAEAGAEEARAVHALLRRLTQRLQPHAPALEAGWRMCIAADDLSARARYAQATGGLAPRVAPAPAALELRGARHPLLLAELEQTVPFDLDLGEDERGLVISGPNTGGKTVALKGVGLVALLAQSGVIPPVGDATVLPVFRRVFADIGDRQSIAENLSTFSARLAALRDVLAEADAGTLVLVDELGSGTDPAEGAALAAAVFTALIRSGALVVATTHLGQLKELATSTPGVVNASLRFDGEDLRPTYELIKGVPGRSYALATARRLGLPEAVLADAEARRSGGERSLDALLAEVEAKASALARREREAGEREAAVRGATADLEALRAELERRAAEVHSQSIEQERAGREQVRAFLLQARRRVEEALGLARAAVSEAAATEARRLVEQGVQAEAEAVKKLKAAAAGKGWSVKGAATPASSPRAPRRAPQPSVSVESRPVASEVDLRGLSGDEAEAVLIRALDDAVLGDLATLRIIHGKGTGALRARVADIVQGDPRVTGFRLASAPQGGSGVTVAELER